MTCFCGRTALYKVDHGSGDVEGFCGDHRKEAQRATLRGIVQPNPAPFEGRFLKGNLGLSYKRQRRGSSVVIHGRHSL